MNDDVRRQLLEVNRRFYQSFGEAYASKRGRPQPGVLEILNGVVPSDDVLDLGCGHGLVAAELYRTGHTGRYRGLDMSTELLDIARLQGVAPGAEFTQVNLADPGWLESVAGHFDWVLAFAILHHLPGHDLRQELVKAAVQRLAQGGSLAVSVWDFLSAPSLRDRIRSWEEVDLRPGDVEPGDYLVDWRHRGRSFRYVHHFSQQELALLAHGAGLSVERTFRSDGRNGRLGLYQVWKQAENR